MKTIPQFLRNDSAVSFGYLAIAAFLIGGTAIWIEFTPVFNQLFIHYNSNIADGMVSVQNQQAMTNHRNVIMIVPIIILLGLAAWGFIRALEQRNQP